MNWFKRQKNKVSRWLLMRKIKKIAEPPTDKELVYTDKSGNRFYVLKNPANLPAERCLPAWVYTNDSEYGLTSARLRYGFAKQKEAINKPNPDLVTISQIIGAFEAADSLYCEPEILLNLASVYTTMNDERFDEFADYIQKEKRRAWDKDNEAKSFFLQFAYRFSKKYSEQPKLNVLDYLKKVKPVLDQIGLNLDPR